MAETQPAWKALSAHVRLVNLTVHEIVPDAQPAGGGGEDPDGPAPPQEIAVGLVIQPGQRSATCRDQVYPVRCTGECLTVPSRDLGRRPVPAEHR